MVVGVGVSGGEGVGSGVGDGDSTGGDGSGVATTGGELVGEGECKGGVDEWRGSRRFHSKMRAIAANILPNAISSETRTSHGGNDDRLVGTGCVTEKGWPVGVLGKG